MKSEMVVPEETDVFVNNQGSLFLFTPLTQAARDWVAENVSLEGWQWLGNAFAVEPRYVEHLTDGMVGDGLVVS